MYIDISWRRQQLSTLVFWPAESRGQRSLASYSPWGCKESDMIEQLYTHTYSFVHTQVYTYKTTMCVYINTCFIYVHNQSLSHVTLCNPMNCSPPDSSVHRIFQAEILEWVATASSRGSSRPRDQIHIFPVSYIVGRFFTCWCG